MNDIIYAGKHAITYSVSKYSHENWELFYCMSGSGEMQFEDRLLKYGQDSVMVVPPLAHCINRSETGAKNIYVKFIDSTFSFKEPTLISSVRNDLLKQAFEAALYYYSKNGIGRTLVLPIYGQLIAGTVYQLSSTIAHREVVQQIIEDILNNYSNADYDLNVYLQSLPFSFEYLKKMFKTEVGKTPRQFLTSVRLESAVTIMRHSCGRLCVAQIARKSGFTEPLYFSRLFKKKYGVSPKIYI